MPNQPQPTRLEFARGTSRKFWQVAVAGKSYTVTFGRLGAAGQSRTLAFLTPAAAAEAARKATAQKLRDGYAPAVSRAHKPAARIPDPAPPAVPRLDILRLRPATSPIRKPVTKFGGQPHWLAGAQWPLSKRTRRPMRFLCQIALDPRLFGRLKARMAYVFWTQPEWPLGDDFFEDRATAYDRGENAVILQPGGLYDGPTLDDADLSRGGPTLYDAAGRPCEFAVDLRPATDPPPTRGRSTVDDDADPFDGDKIGGTPALFQGQQWPDRTRDKGWRLLLQFDTAARREFEINFANALLFAFISTDGRRGKLMGQST